MNLTNEILRLARKYYGIKTEAELKTLSSTQLNKITNWATNTDPDSKAKISGRKYSGKTYGKLKKIF